MSDMDTDTRTHQEDPPIPGIVVRLAQDDGERKQFLKKAGKGVGGGAIAASLAAFIAACGSSKSSSSTTSSAAAASSATTTSSSSTAAATSSDLKIVNYALTLEYLESEFYKKVAASGLFKGATLSTLKSFGAEEDDHVAALHKVAMSLGTPAKKPTGKFPVKSATQVATLAATVENLGAAAYLGQAPKIKSAEVLAAALSIHTIEARHAATLNLLTKKDPTPDGAFAKPATMAAVLKAVTPFIAS